MSQKLSAITYLRNNKPRVSVLVISMALCAVLFYLCHFLLSCTTETFHVLLVEQSKKVQYVSLPWYAMEIDGTYEELGLEEYLRRGHKKYQQLADKLEQAEDIKQIFYAPIIYAELSAVVGQYFTELPLLDKADVPAFMEHCHMELHRGRLPENPGEVLLDEKMMQNGSYHLGDPISQYPDTKIVGTTDSDGYFACGVGGKEENSDNQMLVILSDGNITDMTARLHQMGYEFKDNDANVVDVKTCTEDLQHDVIDAISTSTNVVYIAIVGILSLSMLVVYTAYLRDRRDEWCLYCSIGYPRKTIYYAVLRELLFTFCAAFLTGGLVTAAFVPILDHTLIASIGVICKYFYPEIIGEILCVFVLILGLLQIPVRIALYKIRTIDAMDDELL